MTGSCETHSPTLESAKFARGLITRIIAFGLERGYWKRGDLLSDPFGGVALGGIIAASAGLRWIGVELEPRFKILGDQNIDLHRPTWEKFGDPVPVLVQGDSRDFASIIREQVGAVVTSPPYAESVDSGGGAGRRDVGLLAKWCKENGRDPDSAARQAVYDGYGHTEGQIGALPAGQVDAVVSSPPFLATEGGCKPKLGGTIDDAMMARHNATAAERYGGTEGQIGNLPAGQVDAVVSSPGYGGSEIADNRKTINATISGVNGTGNRRGGSVANTIGSYADPGNVSAATGPTYWEAVRDVYEQVRLALRPGGMLVLVLKSYVKQGRIVDLPEQTARLVESLGFRLFLKVRAWLVKERREAGLFGEEVTRTERKSFFRRLQEKRPGAPRIDFEVVLFCRKPA